MRLADFILDNIEPILVEWESFARSIWPGSEMEPRELRDHAEAILRWLATDMQVAQTSAQQSAKSKGALGNTGAGSELIQSASDIHAIGRASSGFTVKMVLSEYRALRASVLRLWHDSESKPDDYALDDMTRFNESIDQSVAEAVHSYIAEVDRYRQQAEKKRLELEAQTQKTQKLESIGVLAGGIAHDFNNLLAGLFGYVELAKMQTQSGDSRDKINAILGKALSTIDSAKALTQQLLTFSRGGAPRVNTMNLSQPLRDAAAFALSGANVEASFQIPEGLWPCKIDLNQLNQALNNILTNAREAMPKGGIVSITAENLSEGSSLPQPLAHGNYIRISIADQGHGIPADALEHVFDPFFTTKEAGHGLGLSITYSIIRKHGGSISMDSEVNKGTIVHVYLPASSEPVAPVVEEPPYRSPSRGRILVMEDELAVQEVIGSLLEGIGYSAVVAASGEETIQLYEKALHTSRPFDVTILDLTMRGGGPGGKETMQRLLEVDPTAVAIVSSGYSNDPVMTNPEAYGFKSAIPKPYQSKDLDEILRSLMGNSARWLQAV